MNTYVFEVTKYIGVQARDVDEALYKYREGFSDGESEEEVTHIYKDNDFLADVEDDIEDENDE